MMIIKNMRNQESYISQAVFNLTQEQHLEEGYFRSLQGIYKFSDEELCSNLEKVEEKWSQNINAFKEYISKVITIWWNEKKVYGVMESYKDGYSAPFRLENRKT